MVERRKTGHGMVYVKVSVFSPLYKMIAQHKINFSKCVKARTSFLSDYAYKQYEGTNT